MRRTTKLSIRSMLVAAVSVLLSSVVATAGEPTDDAQEATTMTQTATGTFDVQVSPQAPGDGDATAIGRMLLDKDYQGNLEATSKGQMLAYRTEVEGSAGYVAMEQVTGTLAGLEGSFVLQHSGTMSRGKQSLDLHVVPDSATGELEGLTGSMSIRIDEDGQHFYEFEYALP